MTRSQQLYAEAAKFIGTKEVPGSKSNPLIAKWIDEAAKWLNHDDSSTPWCGCFRGHLGLVTATGVPSDHFRAKNWLRWGNSVSTVREAVKGDTVVLVRKGGFHVALFDHLENTKIFLLGGNQGDAVNISGYPLSNIEGIRR